MSVSEFPPVRQTHVGRTVPCFLCLISVILSPVINCFFCHITSPFCEMAIFRERKNTWFFYDARKVFWQQNMMLLCVVTLYRLHLMLFFPWDAQGLDLIFQFLRHVWSSYNKHCSEIPGDLSWFGFSCALIVLPKFNRPPCEAGYYRRRKL